MEKLEGIEDEADDWFDFQSLLVKNRICHIIIASGRIGEVRFTQS